MIPVMAIGVASLAVAACGGSRASDPVEVASVAVRANPSLELVAADEKQGVLTVRVKRTGQILVVKATDVTAGTAFRDLDAGGAAPDPAAGQSVAVSGDAGKLSISASQGASRGQQVAVKGGAGSVAAKSGGGSSAADAGGVDVASGSRRLSVSSGGRGVSVQAPGQGGVSIGLDGAGGISVSRSGSPAAAPRSPAPAAASAPSQPSAPGAAAGASVDDARLQKRTRQIVCSDDSMKLDGVLLRLDEVAVVVTGDCDLKITNSHIVGTTAISADSNATVSIVNTVLEGRSVAVSLSGNATLAAKSSTVHGRVQRTQNTELHDQGGNVWK